MYTVSLDECIFFFKSDVSFLFKVFYKLSVHDRLFTDREFRDLSDWGDRVHQWKKEAKPKEEKRTTVTISYDSFRNVINYLNMTLHEWMGDRNLLAAHTRCWSQIVNFSTVNNFHSSLGVFYTNVICLQRNLHTQSTFMVCCFVSYLQWLFFFFVFSHLHTVSRVKNAGCWRCDGDILHAQRLANHSAYIWLTQGGGEAPSRGRRECWVLISLWLTVFVVNVVHAVMKLLSNFAPVLFNYGSFDFVVFLLFLPPALSYCRLRWRRCEANRVGYSRFELHFFFFSILRTVYNRAWKLNPARHQWELSFDAAFFFFPFSLALSLTHSGKGVLKRRRSTV